MPAVRQDLTVAVKLNDQFSNGLKEIQKETSNTFDEGKKGSFLSGIKGSTVALGALAVTGIAAVGAGLLTAFDKAREFEQAMADVSAITGATGKDFSALSALARDMGATTAHSATDAARGIQFLGMAGFKTDEIMTALPATLDLASAAGMELAAAADISSNILSGMGMNASDLDGVVDRLAQTSRSANTSVGQLGEAFKMVGPTAAASGLSFDDTTISLGLLANAGLQGGIGGSSLNSALRSMIAPSKEADKVAKNLGLTFVDTNGQVLPMVDILKQLDDKSVTTKQSFEIFGTEGARAINALRAQGITAFTALDYKMKESGGVAQDMADTRLGSFDGAMLKLGSAMSEFGIAVGDTFLPVVTLIVDDFLIPAVNETNAFIEAFGGLDTMFRDALTFIVGFKNTALNILSELFNNADFAEAFLGNLGSIFTAAIGAVMTFAFGSPQMGGLGGMVGIIVELGKIIWEPLKQGFLAIWDFIKMPLVAGINWITEQFIGGLNAIITEWNKVGGIIGLSIDAIDFTPLTVEPAKTFKERWAEGTDNVKASWETVETFAKDIGDNIGADIDNVTLAIADTADTAAHLVDEGMTEVIEKWDAATDTMTREAPVEGTKIGEALGGGVEEGFEPEVEIKIEIPSDPNTWKRMLSTVQELPIGQFFSEKFGDVFSESGEVGQAINQGMEGILQGEGFAASVASAAQGLGTAIGGPIGLAITTVAKGVLSALAPASMVERPEYAAIAEEAAFAVEMGGIGKLSLTTEQGRLLKEKQGRYARRGSSAKQTITRTLVEELQGQFGKDRQGQFYLNYQNAWTLAAGLLRDEFYGEQGAVLTAIVRDVIVRSTADELREEKKRGQFRERVGEEAMELAGITAAGGYSGVVDQPTLILAGEAGPEMVEITPTSRMSGGFSGSGGANFHFNFSVNTIDEQGVKSFIETEAKPVILQMLQRESTRGSTVMYSTGLTTDPSV